MQQQSCITRIMKPLINSSCKTTSMTLMSTLYSIFVEGTICEKTISSNLRGYVSISPSLFESMYSTEAFSPPQNALLPSACSPILVLLTPLTSISKWIKARL